MGGVSTPPERAAGAPRWRRWVTAALLVVAVAGLALAATSVLRMVRRDRAPPPPRQTDVGQIAGWMTLPYVARTFRVPPDELAAAVGVPLDATGRRSLDDLARATGLSGEEMIARVRRAVVAHQAGGTAPAKPGKPRPADEPPGPAPP
jgi:hypothetical protein